MVLVAETKIYLPSSGTAPVVPAAFRGGWDDSVGDAILGLPMNLTGSPGATSNLNIEGVLSGILGEWAFAQWISPLPLAAQSFDAALSLDSARMMRTTVTGSTYVAIAVTIVSSTGTLVDTLLTANTTSNLINSSTYENEVRLGTTTSDGVSCSDGDYLCIEMSADAANTGSKTVGLKIGDGNGADLDTSEGDTTVANPWVRFSHDITFLDPGANQLMLTGCGI